MSTQASETVEITGHLMDSGILSRVLDDVREYGGDHVIEKIDVGHDSENTSYARITVTAEDDDSLQRLLMRLQTRGVNMVDPGEVTLEAADFDGVFPDGFYSTTNLDTQVRHDKSWLTVDNPEMDCGLVVDMSGATPRAYTLPMSDIKTGMQVVCGASGIKVKTPLPAGGTEEEVFGFMESDV
ncbi:MAG: TIGR00300 family protein, partial [Nocardioidaceae bacterium]